MSGLAWGVMMLCVFILVVIGAYAVAQCLRRRGHGARLDAIHDATVRVKGRFHQSWSAVFRASRSRGYPPLGNDSDKRD